MFSHLQLSADAQDVLRYASEEARSLRHDWIGIEHIFLGILRTTDSIAYHVLKSFSIEYKSVRGIIEFVFGFGTSETDATMNEEVQRILNLANQKASEHHQPITANHILLALLEDKDPFIIANCEIENAHVDNLSQELLRKMQGWPLMTRP